MKDKPFITIHKEPDTEVIGVTIQRDAIEGWKGTELVKRVEAAQRALDDLREDLLEANKPAH